MQEQPQFSQKPEVNMILHKGHTQKRIFTFRSIDDILSLQAIVFVTYPSFH